MTFSVVRTRPVAVLLTLAVVLSVPAQVQAREGAATPDGLAVAVAPGSSASMIHTVPTAAGPAPEVVLLADVTKTMYSEQWDQSTTAVPDRMNHVKRAESDILDQVLAAHPEARFSVAKFGRPLSDPFTVDPDLTTDRAAVQKAIDDWLAAEPGGSSFADEPGESEDGLNALDQTADSGLVNWLPDSDRTVVIFSDAPPKGDPSPRPSGGPGVNDGVENTIAALQRQGIRLVAVNFGQMDDPPSSSDPTADSPVEAGGQFSRIAARTGGVILPSSDLTAVPPAVLAGIDTARTTVTAQVLRCDPAVGLTVTPQTQAVDSGTPATFTFVARAAPSTRSGEYTCHVAFTVGDSEQSLPQPFAVNVTEGDSGGLDVQPATTVVDFGTQDLGRPGTPRTITLTNRGDGPLTLSTAIDRRPGPTVFTVSSSTCGSALPAAQACELRIVATTRTTGAATSALRLTGATADGRPASRSLALKVTGSAPTVELDPGVGRPGQVIAVVGRGFPPGAVVSLGWSVGTGAVTSVADPAGQFSVPMMVFAREAGGPRAVSAVTPNLATVTSAPFLVGSPSWQPGALPRR